MFKIFVFSMLLIGCVDGVENEKFKIIDKQNALPFINKLEKYLNVYNTDWEMTFYTGNPNIVASFCSSGEEYEGIIGGCMFSPRELVISENYINDCRIWVHELIHVYLYRSTGETDYLHNNTLFDKVLEICYGES